VAARLARQVEVALGQIELSLPQYRILILLDEGPAVASRLAEYLVVSRPTVTAVVDGMVGRGLIVRSHDDDGDRRRIGLTLTAAGRHLLHRADRSVESRLAEVATHLDEPEQALAGLDIWLPALDAYRAARRESKR
jgi:long-chain acyl-CoA synthetase